MHATSHNNHNLHLEPLPDMPDLVWTANHYQKRYLELLPKMPPRWSVLQKQDNVAALSIPLHRFSGSNTYHEPAEERQNI